MADGTARAFDWGLLEPAGGAASAVSDDAVLEGMVAFERALVAAWSELNGSGAAVAESLRADALDRHALADGARAGGVPVIALVDQLRAAAGLDAGLVHRGATSQDVVDTALMLVSREALSGARTDLTRAGRELAALAETHRARPVVARTLTQEAEATTFGAVVASWLDGITATLVQLDAVRFPVQLGGAVGVGRAFAEDAGRGDAPERLRACLAAHLGLGDPGRSWHTERSAVLAVAHAAAQVAAIGGRIGRDLALLARDGSAVPRHGGGSSSMPHKHNPVDAVLLTANGLRAGGLVATLQTAALSYDARPAGEWHAEWQAWRSVLRLALESASLLAHAAGDVEVSAGTVDASPSLLAAADRVVASSVARFEAAAAERSTRS
ncbi:lyase family protein [Leifsonia sp. AG29]|uniref:lyase family protein n=1 Tax=Leifsonia sp. AG29 TaxID=2598860 RepID=UPI00131A7936|nr:lyase family protein [Leifsonia sp. AG29]